ncbi:hypothetical protein ACFWPX_32340 [Nocardia sp. NPDC058518]|uniref:hypothetical protein n=1 Tax=Nocardia sp. NPDC058518 TaxID=3346534 RepID=UPI0036559DF9
MRGQIRTEFGRRACRGLGSQLAEAGGDVVADTAQLVPETATDSTTDRTTESRQTQVGPTEVIHRAIALGDLDGPGERVDPALFQRFERRPTDRGPRGRFGDTARDHPGEELFHRDLHRDLRRDTRSHARRSTDSGPRGRQRDADLDRRHDHRADDHQLGVLDIVGTVFEQLGLLLTPLTDRSERRLVTGQKFVAIGRDRIVRLALRQRRQRRIQRPRRILVNSVERVRRSGPRIGEPPHRGLIAFGPITRSENVFSNPLQRLRDLDTHGL